MTARPLASSEGDGSALGTRRGDVGAWEGPRPAPSVRRPPPFCGESALRAAERPPVGSAGVAAPLAAPPWTWRPRAGNAGVRGWGPPGPRPVQRPACACALGTARLPSPLPHLTPPPPQSAQVLSLGYPPALKGGVRTAAACVRGSLSPSVTVDCKGGAGALWIRLRQGPPHPRGVDTIALECV